MFSVNCSGHGAEVLLSSAHIEALRNTDAGIEVHWRCRCGTRGVQVTGVAADAARVVPATGRRGGAEGRAGSRRPGTAA